MKYRKFYRKTSLKQKGIGEVFLDDVQKKNPKSFFEIGVFHGVTARNVCDLMYKNHKFDFKYIGIDLLKKYRQNVEIITGNTNEELKNLNLKNIEYIFIDGGHDFETVKNDLYFCSKFLKSGGTILCDDYDLSQAPGVKQAIDEFISKNDCKFSIIEKRFVKLEF